MASKTFFSSLIATFILFPASVTFAQNVTSSDVNNLNTHVTHIGNQYNITGGTQAGANLFYSLQKLGLSTGEIANFLTNTSVQNILTRVTGGEASLINGLIQVTGGNSNLFIMNPAGIVFGANASLNVPANFAATTANAIRVGDAWFGMNSSVDQVRNLTGNPNGYAFSNTSPTNTAPTPVGVLVNEGNLNVSNGKSVTLVGGMVVNTGTIATSQGKITITATADNKFIKITNEGNVLSYDLPISDRVAIGATSILKGVDLPKLLTGATAGTAVVSGNLNVSGNQGGNVQVFGDNVSLASANIDASGINGGGTVLIGGNYQGKGTDPTAQTTTVDQSSRIIVDALTNGNGGNVIVWSDHTTRFDGKISAQGGTQNGNGGFTEVSGKQNLTYSGLVDLRATKGITGNLLLDPANFVIANIGGDITPATVVTQWNAANTTYSATNSLTVRDAIAANSANTLTLDAPTINLNAGITNTGTGALSGTANTVNVGTNGTVKNAVDVASNGATVNLASSTYTLGATVAINKDLSINGTTATVISGNNAVGVFNIGNNASVNINNLTIANGKASGSPSFGGGIFVNNGSTLKLSNSNLSNNSADYGAAIYNAGTVTINNSTLAGNTSVQSGGAIYNDGTVTINNSTLSANSAQNNNGGAIANGNANTTLSIVNSTLSGNTSQNGGAIYNYAGTTTVSNSTLFGNSATQQGGAIANDGTMGANGNVTVNNSIIVGNNASTGKEIANNSTLNFTGTNIVGTNGASGISNTGTLTGVTTTPTGAANTVINTTLANNGGLTKTHALVNGSIAINASSGVSTNFDQRGVPTLGIRDVGAFEFLPTPTLPPFTPPKPIFDPNQFFRPYIINFKLFKLWRYSPVAFLSLNDIEFRQFDKFIIIIVNLMNKDGGTVTIVADDIWKDTNMQLFEHSHNQEVIRLSMHRSISRLIGSEYIKLININFEDRNAQKIILVKVRKASRPVKFLSNQVTYAND